SSALELSKMEVDEDDSDWAVTRVIYEAETEAGSGKLQFNLAVGIATGVAKVSINSQNMCFVLDGQLVEPEPQLEPQGQAANAEREQTQTIIQIPTKTVYGVIEPRLPPLHVTFTWAATDLHSLLTAHVTDEDPATRRHFHVNWINWINDKIEQNFLASNLCTSSEIISFVVNDTFAFFSPHPHSLETPYGTFQLFDLQADDKNFESAGFCYGAQTYFSVLISTLHRNAFDTLVAPETYPEPITAPVSRKRKPRVVAVVPETRESTLASFFLANLQKSILFFCAICHDVTLAAAATRLYCGHVFCTECITHYVSMIARECHNKNSSYRKSIYPFVCPARGACGQHINLGADETLRRLLPPDVVDRVVEDLRKGSMEHISEAVSGLRSCLRLACHRSSSEAASASSMRVLNTGTVAYSQKSAQLVYCDACHTVWCERCLQRIPDMKHLFEECDPRFAFDLCARYKRLVDASNSNSSDDSPVENISAVKEKLALVNSKMPWLRHYVEWIQNDLVAKKWVANNASICPGCGDGIERSEGCLHMTCISCDIHFCYECGKSYSVDIIYQHACRRDKISRMNMELENLEF
ncbi:translation termination inhibitor protein itt1, partial [Physocladia obscura]